MAKNKTALVIWLLLLVILILVILVAYVFFVQPAIADRQSRAQAEGYEYAIVSIMQAASQCEQAVPLTYQNVTVNLINAECLQQQAAA